MHMIAKAGLCALLLAAFVPAGKALIGAGGCAVPNKDATLQALRVIPVPHIPQLKLPRQKTETQVLVHISGYGVVMSTKVVKSSGNPFVDLHAMSSVHMSTYSGKIVNCQPIPSDLTVNVLYDPNARQPTPFPMRSLPPTPVPSGEPAPPIQIIQGAALPLPAYVAQPAAKRTLPLALFSGNYGNLGMASAGGILYFNIINSPEGFSAESHPVVAVDLSTGAVLWRRRSGIVAGANQAGVIVSVAPPESEMRAYTRDLTAYLRAHKSPKSVLTELDRKTGRPLFVLPGTGTTGAIDGVAFTQDGSIYSASSVATGKLLWASNGAPSLGAQEPPVVRNDVLLQTATISGAITENVLYAFDLPTGHAKWEMLSNEKPLGFKSNVVYIDSTWFPQRMDYYIPMTIAAVDLATGTKRDEYTYRPDPIPNAAEDYRQAPLMAYVSSGYVYVTVNNRWYRYVAEREPAQAAPVSLGSLSVDATFENGRLLVHENQGTYIAESSPDRLQLHRFAEGDLRSKIVEREDGTRYAVFGGTLYAFDQNAGVRRVGSVENCASAYSIIAWSGHVAVLCGTAGQSATELLFNDKAERIVALHITPQTPPPYRLQIREFQVPGSSADGRTGQWGVGPMAPLSNGGIAITLVNELKNSIMYVSPGGKMRRVPIAPEIAPPTPNANPTPYPTGPPIFSNWPPRGPSPNQLVAGKRGTLWFNDVWHPDITSLSPGGTLATRAVGAGSNARFSSAIIRLASTPDGEVWYARSLPTPQIGRADGSLKFDIPAQYGNPAVFLGGSDNALWFFSAASLVRVTTRGQFTSIALPSKLTDRRTGPPVVTSGSRGTIWAAERETIYHIGSAGVLGEHTLPDATLSVGAMATGCDGSLYVTPGYQGVLFHLRPNGVFERYQVPFYVSNIMRAPDCTIWFVQGTNYPTTSVGTFKLVPR